MGELPQMSPPALNVPYDHVEKSAPCVAGPSGNSLLPQLLQLFLQNAVPLLHIDKKQISKIVTPASFRHHQLSMAI